MAVTPADRNGQEAINEINNGDEGFEVSSGQNGAAQVQNINNDENNEKESRTSMLARHQKTGGKIAGTSPHLLMVPTANPLALIMAPDMAETLSKACNRGNQPV